MALDEAEQKESVHHSIHLVAGLLVVGIQAPQVPGKAPNSTQPSSPARP